ncbi:helicase [Mammaliicoccus sciuri]|uniref:SNF2-related protein n=1 Tax=Mammaliicoccus sciuri TaxID=1296 RepID=UPI000D1EDAEA|nr:SNF2-related protein [Mammaliicoccus sciuri]PTJ59028.1 helicase [Mammaliicoccus sciuri]
MAQYPQFIDNKRKSLAETLRMIAPQYKTLRIATGYWDLPGTFQIIDQIQNYEKIQLLIGQEPIAHHLQKQYNISIDENYIFPDTYISEDLEDHGTSKEINSLRETAKKLVTLIKEKKLEVRVFRKPRLHAKAYIFGDLGEGSSVGIIGSSNFTNAGLTTSQELNYLTDDYKIVEFVPQTDNQENGHITWFDNLWNEEGAEEWTGDFSNIINKSPVGNKTYGPYDVYIKTLMEVFPDELADIPPFDPDIEEILHEFQYQNALSLRRKLDTMGVAMLSDSVGLGKTITASAIIKQYIHEGNNNIVIIPPASLKQQWIDELESNRWNFISGRDFKVITQQDHKGIETLLESSIDRKNNRDEIDLFVVDEAHNLRNTNSTRYQQILKLFQENPNSKVLLLTATPINNSLMDFANQIQLGSKGDLVSVNVPYSSGTSPIEYIDFFEALKRIQSQVLRAEKTGNKLNWSLYKNTLTSGLRHYLVRSTREGVIKRNAITPINENQKLFPNTRVEQFSYGYDRKTISQIKDVIEKKINDLFDGIDPRYLNLDLFSEITQRTTHPIDLYNNIDNLQKKNMYHRVIDYYNLDEKFKNSKISNMEKSESVIPLIFQLINFLGFTPYKPESYSYNIYGKSISDIRALSISGKEISQLSIHNMLQITWLKRLESSTMALLKSVKNYKEKIVLFEKWLNKGYIVSLGDALYLESDYGEDIDRAFNDYEEYLEELDRDDEKTIKKKGIERKIADSKIYNLDQLRKDIKRDKNISNLIINLLDILTNTEVDKKVNVFANKLAEIIKSGDHGKKVLVFSFFSDTIDYLENTLPPILEKLIPNFKKEAAFISGNSKEIESISRRFSPQSKKYSLKDNEHELNYLFATDVLSEGQNLQDSGILVNYDLHWNPVRMIQRNGRINRLGSKYNEILIANARPNEDLETYLKLVRRLERKIDTINSTVGNDQSILGEEVNPVEFNDMLEYFDKNTQTASKAANKLEYQEDPLNWVDDYSLELRDFLEKHKEDGEVERIKSIPKGKWNYLPYSQNKLIDLTEVIGLYTTDKKVTSTGKKITNVGFVKISSSGKNRGPFSSIRAEYMEEEDALLKIKTVPADNTMEIDNIKVNREEYITKGNTEVEVHFETSKASFILKPSHIKALEIVAAYFDFDVLDIIQRGINRSNEKREFERLIKKLNKEVKETGSPFFSTIHKFDMFIKNILSKKEEEQKLEKIEGVLFYAHKY